MDNATINMSYSVLMSVYYKEKADYLREAMESIWNQTYKTNDFVLICDGPLTSELNDVISEMRNLHPNELRVIRLKQNKGLGYSLNVGLKKCKNELVARMDSDDISEEDRCAKQLDCFAKDPDLKACSGTVREFVDDKSKAVGKRSLPLKMDEIIKYSRKRNPMNHPCVMFKKEAVTASGGYKETFHLFEDYYLWIRMLKKNYKLINLKDILLDMRTPTDIYKRRGGVQYAKEMLRFHRWLVNTGWTKKKDFIIGAIPHALICVLPTWVRKMVYKVLH